MVNAEKGNTEALTRADQTSQGANDTRDYVYRLSKPHTLDYAFITANILRLGPATREL